ncbi:MAG TPA: glycosyltransferase [Pyrinomonadaceae bacterium]|nr:glycosyltransferase [Pyrinomonadaceae bacterium]
MISVTAITSGRDVPSSRHRVRQFVEPLRRHGVAVTEHYARPNKYLTKRVWPLGLAARVPALLAARSSDITWLEREMIPGRATVERFAGRRRVLDVDDAIWLANDSDFSERLASACDGVIAGNDAIAAHYRPHARRVWVVPTSVDTTRWRPSSNTGESEARRRGKWTVGWIGTSSNLPYLYAQEDALAEFLESHADSELLVVCDRRPRFERLARRSYRFARWSAEAEVELVREMNVGLMPLADTEWARGKCALKMLQYMAVGIPVVASPVGANLQVFAQGRVGLPAASPEEWFHALRLLHSDAGMCARMGAEGRALVEEKYSVERNARALADVFREVLDA